MTEPVFPYREISENVVISCIFQRPEILLEQTFSPEMFSCPRNIIFLHLCELACNHDHLTLDMVFSTFSLAELAEIGGKGILQEILFYTSPVEDWRFSYKFLLEAYQRRRRMEFALKDLNRCANLEETFDPDALLKFDYGIQLRKPEEKTRALFQRVRDALFDKKAAQGLMHLSGITALDQTLGYVRPGNVIVIGAKTSLGKSAMAHNIAGHACWNGYRKNVAIFSMEMKQEEVVERLFSQICSIRMSDIRDRELSSQDGEKMDKFIATIDPDSDPLRIIDDSIQEVEEIQSRCRQIKKKGGLDLVIVDYLQLISPGLTRDSNRQNELATISRKLKMMANDLNVIVVSLSQLNEQNQLRESRAIGHDADIVLYIVNPNGEDETSSLREIQINKSRHGAKANIEVDFFPPYVSFSNRA
jgi:replicative DNA helicase